MSDYDELKKKWRDCPGKIGISYQDTYELIQAADTALADKDAEIARLKGILEKNYICPQCGSVEGVKIPRGLPAYCEDCGWPDEDFDHNVCEHGRDLNDYCEPCGRINSE
jgi:uncharacterized Zn finger protein